MSIGEYTQSTRHGLHMLTERSSSRAHMATHCSPARLRPGARPAMRSAGTRESIVNAHKSPGTSAKRNTTEAESDLNLLENK